MVQQPGRPTVEFFYAAACPWTYLAFTRLREAALRTGSRIRFRPVAGGGPGELVSGPLAGLAARTDPRVAAWLRQDLQDWARFCGVTIHHPGSGADAGELAQRGAVVAAAFGREAAYAEAIFRAALADGLDIGRRDVVLKTAAGCGLPADEFAARLDAEEVVAALATNGAELLRRGGFGSPTLFVGDEMYFGHDRLPLVEAALLGGHEQPFIAPGEHDR